MLRSSTSFFSFITVLTYFMSTRLIVIALAVFAFTTRDAGFRARKQYWHLQPQAWEANPNSLGVAGEERESRQKRYIRTTIYRTRITDKLVKLTLRMCTAHKQNKRANKLRKTIKLVFVARFFFCVLWISYENRPHTHALHLDRPLH